MEPRVQLIRIAGVRRLLPVTQTLEQLDDPSLPGFEMSHDVLARPFVVDAIEHGMWRQPGQCREQAFTTGVQVDEELIAIHRPDRRSYSCRIASGIFVSLAR